MRLAICLRRLTWGPCEAIWQLDLWTNRQDAFLRFCRAAIRLSTGNVSPSPTARRSSRREKTVSEACNCSLTRSLYSILAPL